MTDKEFKRLSRSQLIEIIYQFQIKVEELTQENQTLNESLADKRLRITRAGNIADAALEINNVMQSAQNAAQQYLDEIQALYSEIDAECENIREKANTEAAAVIGQANAEAAEIIAHAQAEVSAMISKAQAEASAVICKAQAEANAIADQIAQKQQAEETLAEILSEYGSSSGV